jgi:hypothetical protein
MKPTFIAFLGALFIGSIFLDACDRKIQVPSLEEKIKKGMPYGSVELKIEPSAALINLHEKNKENFKALRLRRLRPEEIEALDFDQEDYQEKRGFWAYLRKRKKERKEEYLQFLMGALKQEQHLTGMQREALNNRRKILLNILWKVHLVGPAFQGIHHEIVGIDDARKDLMNKKEDMSEADFEKIFGHDLMQLHEWRESLVKKYYPMWRIQKLGFDEIKIYEDFRVSLGLAPLGLTQISLLSLTALKEIEEKLANVEYPKVARFCD